MGRATCRLRYLEAISILAANVVVSHFQVLARPSPGSERRRDNNSSSLGLIAGLPASILAVVALVGVLVYRRRHLK